MLEAHLGTFRLKQIYHHANNLIRPHGFLDEVDHQMVIQKAAFLDARCVCYTDHHSVCMTRATPFQEESDYG